MTFIPARHAASVLTVLFVLTACEQGLQDSASSETQVADDAATSAAGRTEVREVEMPEVFSVTESALWDGRPSLGGVWVAHPDVAQPESVVIRNKANDKSVAGALFRRERNNPGPRIQVSSDAAAALGMLAGQPAELSIVAVRREEIVIEPAPVPISEETPGAEEVAPAGTTKAAAAAPPPERPAEDDAAAATLAGTAAAATSGDADSKPGFWQRFRESLKNKPASDIATEADTKALEAATAATPAPEVQTQTLDPVASTAAAAIDKAEEKKAAEPETATAAAAEPGKSPLKNPFVQVGLFGEEPNASAAAASLRQAGIVPAVDKTTINGKPFWRVLVGPIMTTGEQSALLDQVKQLGYADAYLVPK